MQRFFSCCAVSRTARVFFCERASSLFSRSTASVPPRHALAAAPPGHQGAPPAVVPLSPPPPPPCLRSRAARPALAARRWRADLPHCARQRTLWLAAARARSLSPPRLRAISRPRHPQRKMLARSDRVKSVEMHPGEPWVLCALYSGKAVIYNHTTGAGARELPPLPSLTRALRGAPARRAHAGVRALASVARRVHRPRLRPRPGLLPPQSILQARCSSPLTFASSPCAAPSLSRASSGSRRAPTT